MENVDDNGFDLSQDSLYKSLPRFEQVVWDAQNDVHRNDDLPNWSPHQLTEPLLTVWAVAAVVEKTNNGSIQHFFEFDWPEFPPYQIFVDALDRIAAFESATILRSAVAVFTFPSPERDVESRREIIDASFKDAEESGEASRFDKWGHRLIDLTEENYRLLSDYIRGNISSFPTVAQRS